MLKLAHSDLRCDKSVRDDLNGLHFKIGWNRAQINTLSVLSLFLYSNLELITQLLASNEKNSQILKISHVTYWIT